MARSDRVASVASGVPPQGGILFVTGFWSAETLGRTSTRATESYLRLFAEMERQLPFALHVWIEPDLEPRLAKIVPPYRRHRPPRTVAAKHFDELPYSHLTERCEALPHMVNADPKGKESIAFTTTSWAKASLVDEAARLHDVAGADARVAWIDFGLAHVADMRIDWTAIERAIRSIALVQVCEMRPTSK